MELPVTDFKTKFCQKTVKKISDQQELNKTSIKGRFSTKVTNNWVDRMRCKKQSALFMLSFDFSFARYSSMEKLQILHCNSSVRYPFLFIMVFDKESWRNTRIIVKNKVACFGPLCISTKQQCLTKHCQLRAGRKWWFHRIRVNSMLLCND